MVRIAWPRTADVLGREPADVCVPASASAHAPCLPECLRVANESRVPDIIHRAAEMADALPRRIAKVRTCHAPCVATATSMPPHASRLAAPRARRKLRGSSRIRVRRSSRLARGAPRPRTRAHRPSYCPNSPRFAYSINLTVAPDHRPAVPGVSAAPFEDNLRYFNVVIEGPPETPFQGALSARERR